MSFARSGLRYSGSCRPGWTPMKGEGRNFSAPLLLIALLSLALKIGLALLVSDMTPAPDESQYIFGARNIARCGVPAYPNPNWDEAHASPVYPYFLGACFRLLPGTAAVTAARLAQAVLSTLTVLLIYRIARRGFGKKVALVSAGVTAFYPPLVAFSHYLYAETIYTFLLVLLAATLLGAGEKPGAARSYLAGLIGGVAALTRSVFLAQIPFLLIWFFLANRAGRRWNLAVTAIFLAGIFTVIAPWTVRNVVRYDGFLLIDSNAGNVLYKNLNAIRQENHDIGMGTRWREEAASYSGAIPLRPRVKIDGIAERNAAEVRRAVLFVLRHPALYAGQCVLRAAELVNPTSFTIKAIRRGYYPGLSPGLAEILVWITMLSVMAVLAAGAVGIWGGGGNPDRTLPLLLVVGNMALAVMVVSMSRYRLPMMPFLIPIGTAAALQGGRFFVRHGRPVWRRIVPAAAALLLMGWAWVIYVPFSF